MSRAVLVCVAGVLLLAVVIRPADGASRVRMATATVTVAAVAKLSLSASTLSFPDANPDSVPNIPSAGGPIMISMKVRTAPGSMVSLSVQASDDLRSGISTIPVSAIRWSTAGSGFVSGMMSTTVAQSVGSWVGSGAYAGTQAYTLTNSWNYATGSYSSTFVYTLTAP